MVGVCFSSDVQVLSGACSKVSKTNKRIWTWMWLRICINMTTNVSINMITKVRPNFRMSYFLNFMFVSRQPKKIECPVFWDFHIFSGCPNTPIFWTSRFFLNFMIFLDVLRVPAFFCQFPFPNAQVTPNVAHVSFFWFHALSGCPVAPVFFIPYSWVLQALYWMVEDFPYTRWRIIWVLMF